MIRRIGELSLHWIDLLYRYERQQVMLGLNESQELTAERLTPFQQVSGRMTATYVRRSAAGLCLIGIGFLWWQLASSSAPGRIFGRYSIRDFSVLVVASYILLWGAYYAGSHASLSGKTLNFSLTSITLLILIGLLEIPAMLGIIDYRRVISPPENYLMRQAKPWENPANLLDKELIHRHRPGQRIEGETKGDLVDWLGIPTNQRYPVDVQFDSHGFRNDHEIENAPFVVVGDSFVEGILVNQTDLVSTRLRNKFAVEVANLGQSGYGPQQELAVLRRFGFKLSPKVVLWFFFEGNDLSDVARYERFTQDWEEIVRKRESFIQRSFIRNLLVTLVGFTSPNQNNDGTEARRRSGTLLSNQNNPSKTIYFAYAGAPLSQDDLVSLDTVENSLLQAHKLSADSGAQFLVAFVPTKFRVYRDFCEFPEDGYGRGWKPSDLPSRMKAWCKDNGISYLDLTPALKQSAARGELVYFPDDGHWNAEGHKVVAEAVSKFIEARGWRNQSERKSTLVQRSNRKLPHA